MGTPLSGTEGFPAQSQKCFSSNQQPSRDARGLVAMDTGHGGSPGAAPAVGVRGGLLLG